MLRQKLLCLPFVITAKMGADKFEIQLLDSTSLTVNAGQTIHGTVLVVNGKELKTKGKTREQRTKIGMFYRYTMVTKLKNSRD